MPAKNVGHFVMDLTIIKVRVKTIATKNDSYDVYVYTAKLGTDEFRFQSEEKTFQIYDKMTIDINVTRETSKQKKLNVKNE